MSKPTHGKGDRNRSISKAWQESSYWSKENTIGRMITKANIDGWRDIHGGDHGAYWRGINPETNKVEKLPKKYTINL